MKPQSFVFLSVLFISISLIYLVLCKTGINITIEKFEMPSYSSSSSSKNSVAFKLGIPETRLYNYKESGDINDTNNFKITFDIYPRTISEIGSSSTLESIEKKINDIIKNKEIITIQTSNGQKVYMEKIKIDYSTIQQPETVAEKEKNAKNTKDEFVNPAIDSEINYMNYLKTGIHKEISIEPRYKFNNMGQLVLEPIPTPSPSPTPSPTPTTIPTTIPTIPTKLPKSSSTNNRIFGKKKK